MQDNIFKKLNFKYNPYNDKILEKYNIQLDNNDNNSLNNNNIKDKNNKDENYKREFKYYYYKDSLDKIYKYTINRFYNLKKIYYSFSDTKCNGVGIISIIYGKNEKENLKICEFKPKKINNNYHSISLENHSYNRIK